MLKCKVDSPLAFCFSFKEISKLYIKIFLSLFTWFKVKFIGTNIYF